MKILLVIGVISVIGFSFSYSIKSINAYAEWGLEHKELNNIRDIWIGSWQNPFYIVKFVSECSLVNDYYNIAVPMGNEHVEYFTSNKMVEPECTINDYTRIQSYTITDENPYQDSGICTIDFDNANTRQIGAGKYSIPYQYRCFEKISDDKCDWVYGLSDNTNYCDIPSELSDERFYGLAQYFEQLQSQKFGTGRGNK